MTAIDYTLVLGVDRKHLKQLAMVWPSWIRHKPDFLNRPLVVFYDQTEGISREEVNAVIHQHPNPIIYSWPSLGITYQGDPNSKFHHPQRYKMLAGFVHVPALTVTTPYWLKLDTDVVATGKPDWIDPNWFKDNPAIVAHRWNCTKPPNQMVLLDQWVERNRKDLYLLSQHKPLNLIPEPRADKICHKRIISWCGFFSTALTRLASEFANRTCGVHQLPVPSQDGYLWYIATRLQQDVKRVIMRDERGWEWWCTETNIRKAADRAVCNGI